MTYGELALLRYILEQVKEDKKVILSFYQKVDADSLYNYFDNLITEIEKDKIKNPKVEYQKFQLWLDVRSVRGVKDEKTGVNEKEKDPEKGEEDQGKQSKDGRSGMEHTKDRKKRDHSKEKKSTKIVSI